MVSQREGRYGGRYHEVGQAVSSEIHPINFAYVAADNCANESLKSKTVQLLLQLLVSVMLSSQLSRHHHRAFHPILWHVKRLPKQRMPEAKTEKRKCKAKFN